MKSAESILHKAQRIQCPLTVEDIRKNILDIAGVRIICSFISDTYRIAALLAGQADVTVVEVEDYIAKPKPNGYKSLHITVEVPGFHEQRGSAGADRAADPDDRDGFLGAPLTGSRYVSSVPAHCTQYLKLPGKHAVPTAERPRRRGRAGDRTLIWWSHAHAHAHADQ